MQCDNCGEKHAARLRYSYERTTDQNTFTVPQKITVSCDVCGRIPPVWMPDVYLGGPGGHPMTDPNLCDPKTGKEIPFSTKREKAAVMRYLGLQQARCAEKQHGSRNEMYLHPKQYFDFKSKGSRKVE